jgi:glycosyltransferase involved in cell wall biosynthesis
MKITCLSPYPVLPLSYGGKIRIFKICSGLAAQGSAVDIIAPCGCIRPKENPGNNPRFYNIYYPFIHSFLFTDRPFPYQFLASFHPGYRFLIHRHLDHSDIYQFEHASFADLVDYLPKGSTIIYNSQNVEFDYSLSECRMAGIKNLVSRRIYRLEKKLVHAADKVLACSAADKSRFIELYGVSSSKIYIAQNGIDIEPKQEEHIKTLAKTSPGVQNYKKIAVFCGSNVAHNRAAADWIIHHLAQQLKDEWAIVIKGGCGKRFHSCRMKNVFIDDRIDGFAEYAALSPVCLNPVTFGGGTSFKILEYLAFNLKVVSTPFGMRGYPDLMPMVKTAELNQFAEAIETAHQKPSYPRELLKNYSWEAITRNLNQLYIETISEKS